MFPYSSIYNPFPYINPENNIASSDENPNFPHSSQLPTLLQDDGLLLSHLLSQQQLLAGIGSTTSQADQTEASLLGWNQAVDMNKGFLKKKKSCSESRQTIPRKRNGKKDRHSKICTAQGPRDRRMRLSLQIARKFFDLQDMLGFDKASKTIDWLFQKSKNAIKELKCCKIGAQSSSASDQSEVVSTTTMEAEFFSSGQGKSKARERTRVKMKIRGDLENSRLTGTTKDSSQHLWESKSLETGEETPRRHCDQEMYYSLKTVTEADEEPATELPDEHVDSVKLLGLISDHGSQQRIAVSTGTNSEDDFIGFPGNWDGDYNYKLQESFSCTMTNTRRFTTTGNVQVQNPSAIFMTYSDTQDEKPSSIFLTTSDTSQELNPNSFFMTNTFNIAHEKNPSSNLVDTSNIFWQSQFLENQFTCNPNISNKNHIYY
ncbi:hypothetical protein FNV43_RR26509 [Rhamnella rubrinervis]|uniref:TCP domain-containing protein n=1 Tax=Rhamnella rubrinervis TaxID=2594499 RepID=A0A8K0GPA8_9ROSA|nr:hypothetical protein FNV43_RR26509 [Rhamnella rubrinervis]